MAYNLRQRDALRDIQARYDIIKQEFDELKGKIRTRQTAKELARLTEESYKLTQLLEEMTQQQGPPVLEAQLMGQLPERRRRRRRQQQEGQEQEPPNLVEPVAEQVNPLAEEALVRLRRYMMANVLEDQQLLVQEMLEKESKVANRYLQVYFIGEPDINKVKPVMIDLMRRNFTYADMQMQEVRTRDEELRQVIDESLRQQRIYEEDPVARIKRYVQVLSVIDGQNKMEFQRYTNTISPTILLNFQNDTDRMQWFTSNVRCDLQYNEEIENMKFYQRLRDIIRRINMDDQFQQGIFEVNSNVVVNDPIEWMIGSLMAIEKHLFKYLPYQSPDVPPFQQDYSVQIEEDEPEIKWDRVNTDNRLEDPFIRQFLNRDISKRLQENRDWEAMDTDSKLTLRNYIEERVIVAWLGEDPIQVREVFRYLFNNTPLFKMFFMFYDTPGTVEAKIDLYDYALYMYNVFCSGYEIAQPQIGKENRDQYFKARYMELFIGTLRNAGMRNYKDYIRLFKCDVNMLLRVITLLSIDMLKLVQFAGNTGIDMYKLIQNPVEVLGYRGLTQRFSRFTAFVLGGFCDQTIQFSQEGGRIQYESGSVTVEGMNSLHVVLALFDMLTKVYSFDSLPENRSQVYLMRFINGYKFREGYMTSHQRNNKQGNDITLALPLTNDKGKVLVNAVIRKDFDVNMVQVLQLGTYAIVDSQAQQQVRFSMDALSRVCDILVVQFQQLMNTDYVGNRRETDKIAWRVECLLVLENAFIQMENYIRPAQERANKTLGAKIEMKMGELRKLLNDGNRIHRFILGILKRVLQVDDARIITEEAEYQPIRTEIEGINIDDEDIYESGLSVDDLKQYIVNNQLGQEIEDQNMQLLDIQEKEVGGVKVRSRRNFYFENREATETFSVSIKRVAQVVFFPDEGFQWWKTRAITQPMLHVGRKPRGANWSKLHGVQNKGYVPVQLQMSACGLWLRIENLFDRYNCQQHIFIYFTMMCGVLDYKLFMQENEYDCEELYRILDAWPEFEMISDSFPYMRDVLMQMSQDTFLQKMEVKYYDVLNPQGSLFMRFPVCDDEFFSEVSIIGYNKHVLICNNRVGLDQCLNVLLNEDCLDLITKSGDYVYRPDFLQNFNLKHMKYEKDQNMLKRATKEFQDYTGDYSQFYENHLKPKFLSQGPRKIYLFYDMETTTKRKVDVGESHDMKVYMICGRIVFGGYSMQEQCKEQLYCGFLRHQQKFIWEGRNALNNFILFLKEIYYRQLATREKRNLLITGWNSRKFDSQFLVTRLMADLPYDTKLTGTTSNPKAFTIGERIQFHDAMDMVSPMSLERFCKAMQVQGKFDSTNLFKIQSMQDWEDMKVGDEQSALQIMEYCQQDVDAMANALHKFNSLILDIVKEIRGETIGFEKNYWILEKTMAKLAYTVFLKHIFLPTMRIFPLQNYELFVDVGVSYRGGYVNNFYFGCVDVEGEQNGMKVLDYVDVNSLYPSVMANAYMPLEFNNMFTPWEKVLYREDQFDIIEPLDLYRIDGFRVMNEEDQIVNDLQCFGFFGVKCFDEHGNVTKTIYPRAWKGNDKQPYLVVWGSELLLFSKLFMRLNGTVSVLGVWNCTKKGKIFAPIREMYAKRMLYKNDPEKKALAEALKIKMNSCYGRFGMKAYEVSRYFHVNALDGLDEETKDFYMSSELQRIGSSTIRSQRKNDFEDIRVLETHEDGQIMKFRIAKQDQYMPTNEAQRLKHVASFIASQARCRLLATLYQIASVQTRILRDFKRVQVLYCDTDSVVLACHDQFTRNCVAQLQPFHWCNLDNSYSSCVRMSDNLGDLKSEIEQGSVMTKFQVFGPKFYRYEIKKGETRKWTYKSKGINQKVVTEFDVVENNQRNNLLQEQFFNMFQNELSAKIEQQQIRNKQGKMKVLRFVKENRTSLARKLVTPGIDAYLNQTECFDCVEEYNELKKKQIKLNKISQHYYYEE